MRFLITNKNVRTMSQNKPATEWEVEKALELGVTVEQVRGYEREAKATLCEIVFAFSMVVVGILLKVLGVFH